MVFINVKSPREIAKLRRAHAWSRDIPDTRFGSPRDQQIDRLAELRLGDLEEMSEAERELTERYKALMREVLA